jgi:hypothetical protein
LPEGVGEPGDSAVSIAGRVRIATEAHRVYRTEMIKLINETSDREGSGMPLGNPGMRSAPSWVASDREGGADGVR